MTAGCPQTEANVMLKNEIYNLMEAGSVLSKRLHRYGARLEDTKDCPNCQQIWNSIASSITSSSISIGRPH